MTNHAVEYFHTLVEYKFERDQYEVIYTEGKYHVTIPIPYKGDSPAQSYYTYSMYEKKMRQCVEGLIKPENFKLQVILPIKLKMYHDQKYYERIKKILRVKD
jgi:hypothetical protein